MPKSATYPTTRTSIFRALRAIVLAPLVTFGLIQPARAANFSSIAFYYGNDVSAQPLAQFDVAVVEPDHGFIPAQSPNKHTRWLAYISVGEVLPSRAYFNDIPHSWLAGSNATWQSTLVDQSQPGWPAFVVSKIAKPLWKQGYRGFFLDTLDSYQLIEKKGPKLLEAQRQGLLQVIRALRHAFPKSMLIMNRGFELLPDIHKKVDAVAFESLYKGWDQAKGQYVDVPEDDRKWLLAQAAKVQAYGLPVIAIDYCPPGNVECTRTTATRIRKHGFIPYIGDGHLQTVNLNVLVASDGQ